MSYGDKPFGVHDIKITNMAGSVQEDLPAARTMGFTPRLRSGELTGDDSLIAIVSIIEAFEGSLESGGISLEAYAIMTGETVVEAGTSPNETKTMTFSAGDVLPYFKLYGQIVGEGSDDIHVKFWKVKLSSLEGSFGEGEFYVTSGAFIAVDDGTNGIVDVVQNETATTLPTT